MRRVLQCKAQSATQATFANHAGTVTLVFTGPEASAAQVGAWYEFRDPFMIPPSIAAQAAIIAKGGTPPIPPGGA